MDFIEIIDGLPSSCPEMLPVQPAALRTSVVMCTYNGAAYLREQCESLLAQSRLPDELIIADDASSDTTPSDIDAFSLQCSEAGVAVVVCLRQENVGFVENFAGAMALATGDIVFLCDQDDIWYANKLKNMIACFETQPDLTLLFSDARLVDAAGESLGQTLFGALELQPWEWRDLTSGEGFPVLLRRAVVTGAAAAFRRSLIALALPVPPGWIHDEWLATVGSMVGRIAPFASPQIDYRQHGGNQIGMRRRTLAMRLRDIFIPRNMLLEVGLKRMDGLQARFGTDPNAPEKWRSLLKDRMAHYEQRIRIGERARVTRLLRVVSEWRTGRYQTYSNGVSSVIRDLLRAA